GAIEVRKADSGQVIRSLTGHKDVVAGLAVSRDGRRLASGSQDGDLLLWDLARGIVIHRLTLPGGKATTLDFPLALSPDGTILASGTATGTIHLWRVADGRLIQDLSGHLGAVRQLKFHPDGKRLVSAGMDRRARVWDVQTGQEALTLRGATNQASS